MLAAWYERAGPASEVLQVGDMLDPEPSDGEVRIRLTRSGVNPGDVKKRGDWVSLGMREEPGEVHSPFGKLRTSWAGWQGPCSSVSAGTARS